RRWRSARAGRFPCWSTRNGSSGEAAASLRSGSPGSLFEFPHSSSSSLQKQGSGRTTAMSLQMGIGAEDFKRGAARRRRRQASGLVDLEVCAGGGDGFAAGGLPGGDGHVGHPAPLAPYLALGEGVAIVPGAQVVHREVDGLRQIGRASCRERV